MKCYAVNDRPVAVIPTADGGEDCVVFDWATGELLPDRSYFQYLTPGSGKDVDALTAAEFEALVAVRRAEAGARAAALVRDWAERLCATSGGAVRTTEALGWHGTAAGGDVVVAVPGYREVKVKTLSGDRAAVQLSPAGGLLTLGALEAGLGPARELPIPPDSWLEAHLAYYVSVAGAAARCTVFAHIRHQAAALLLLRRD